jgi:hypothetical protein
MPREPRKNTNKIMGYVKEGIFDCENLIRDLLNYMSEAEVTEFMESNGYEFEEDDDE